MRYPFKTDITKNKAMMNLNQRIFINKKTRNLLRRSERRLLDEIFDYVQSLETGPEEPKIEKEKDFLRVRRGEQSPHNEYQRVYLKFLTLRNNLLNKAVTQDEKANKEIGEKPYCYPKSSSSRSRKENAEAANRMSKRRQNHNRDGASIPEYEEGTPKPGWFTDDDLKKMRKQDYADMKNNHRE